MNLARPEAERTRMFAEAAEALDLAADMSIPDGRAAAKKPVRALFGRRRVVRIQSRLGPQD